MPLGTRILLVEDDEAVSYVTSLYLQKEGHTVITASTAQEMLTRLDAGHVDLILLDLNLPDEDGLVLIRRVRTRSRIPIIVVSSRVKGDDKVTGLELGADDYVTKPFDPRELVLRVRNLLMRSEIIRPSVQRHRVGRWVVDMDARVVVAEDGAPVELTRGEFNLVAALVVNTGRVLSREQLMDAVSSIDAPANRKSIDVLVHRLRRKLENDPGNPCLIVTVPGVGYRLVGNAAGH